MEERLQLAQASKQEALERARIEREREALEACTFVPQLVTQPERLLPGDYAPPHRRAGEEAQRRSGKLAQARLVAVSGGGGCGVVAAPVDGALRAASCTCRLDASRPVRVVPRNFYATTSRRQAEVPRVCLLLTLLQGLADAGLTFQPHLNPRSLKLAAEKEDRELHGQAGSGRRPSSAPRTGSHGGDAFTFVPAINRTSERLLEDSSSVPTGGVRSCLT